ncbi:MAG: hypothetical protein H7330_12910 [Hymenobacteraceae bacterium]|nr:hypothetical protein [Hymenobacteraceae bacterium]
MQHASSPSDRHGRRAALVALALAAALPGFAQNELSNFTATGRGGAINALATEYQALGINPANLGRATGVKVAFTVGEFGASLSSRTASRTIFNNYVFNTEKQFPRNQDGSDLGATATNPIGPERQKVIDAFTGENVAITQSDVTPFAISYYNPTIGGIAINTRYRMLGSADLNRNAAELILAGNNATIIREARRTGTFPLVAEALKGTHLQIQAVQEFNIAYGRRVFEGEGVEVSLGLGFRFIRGIGILDVRSDGKTLSAYGALSPVFDAEYPVAIAHDAGFNQKTSDGSSAKFPSVGSGSAIDVGISATIAKKIHLSASIVDVGKMTWKANSVEIDPKQRLQVFGQTPDEAEFNASYQGPITYNFWKSLKRFQIDSDSTSSPFKYRAAGKREVKLPTRVRLGAGTDLTKKITIAIDGQLPFDKNLPGSYRSALVGAGVTYKPVYWLHLSTGVSGGAGFGASIPLGIAFVTRSYEGGIATRDITGYFGETNPYLSVVAGFLRFKIGAPNNDE